jgi:glyoxylase-like metal-dependent hydrolase (beta-lactamase superfamily II)/rhodanese-related sulfurtransferase
MLIFRQLFDPQSSTYTYLLGDGRSREALIIDPVFEQASRDVALVRELGLELLFTLETHVHADHVTGAWLLKRQLGNRIGLSKDSGAVGADLYLTHGDKIALGLRHLQVRATPGHTNGCLTYVLDDESMAFTGDCLLIRGSGRTDFQQGDPHAIYRSIRTQIFTLPEQCLLYPGHDYRGLTVTSVAEEQRYNPRLGAQISEDDFVGYMDNLGLPHPKQIAVALPANLKCGRPERDDIPLTAPSSLPLTYTFAGFWEIQPQALEEAAEKAQIIDVREQEEFEGRLGHIPGAKLIPLGDLARRASELARDRLIIIVCRSGARSAQATVILQRAGFNDVANLAGGMLRWRADGHAVEGGQD